MRIGFPAVFLNCLYRKYLRLTRPCRPGNERAALAFGPPYSLYPVSAPCADPEEGGAGSFCRPRKQQAAFAPLLKGAAGCTCPSRAEWSWEHVF